MRENLYCSQGTQQNIIIVDETKLLKSTKTSVRLSENIGTKYCEYSVISVPTAQKQPFANVDTK